MEEVECKDLSSSSHNLGSLVEWLFTFVLETNKYMPPSIISATLDTL